MKVLVVGATGHVGSQAAQFAQEAGHTVRAMVRREGTTFDAPGIEPVLGDLADRESLRRALHGIEVVVATANAIIPQGRTQSIPQMARDGYGALIEEAEAAGVRHFILASVPAHPLERAVPELAAKRTIEALLMRSRLAYTILRNPAFTDVWLVMAGAGQAAGRNPFATTGRSFGFVRLWQALTGNLVQRRGVMLAPGGAGHGAPFITTQDVARMLVGVIGKQKAFNRVIEAGGPEWLTWRDVADLLSRKTGRRVRIVAMPSWLAATAQLLVRPFSAPAGNVLGLVRFVATHQPRWDAPTMVEEFDLPPQVTVAQYLDTHWSET
ncbi:SDR family oxidoreductase [Hasllibacter sp. MH4015]|uniref:SDR family oxidoreductase n=1 Tax=Hasllibacter sp. MH4015 TaxID=2854029 RepID=UPI001CD6D73B|nr:NmrA family NAD(P)-binding protein [Hasllibacter sp. MH4015]